MEIDVEKKEIIREILNLKNEGILKAIRKLLDLDVDSIPEDHKLILNERIAKYRKKPDDVIDWDDLKKELFKD